VYSTEPATASRQAMNLLLSWIRPPVATWTEGPDTRHPRAHA
jgi:hypothetical protein